MFELFSEDRRRAPHRSSIPVLISTATHVIVLGVLLAIPILYVSTDLPEVPDMMTFVVSAAPPPPPPPPPPAPASTPVKAKVVKPVPTVTPRAAPVEAPREIVEEPQVDTGGEEGVPGGIEGGIPGGVLGGLLTELPPPPPPAPMPQAPVRVGGEVKAPALVERVEPEYPPLAVRAQVQGVVILEAVVDREGRVEDLRVLRSIPLLDRAAIDAVRQWRYSPLLLNGTPERFVLTVTVSFNLSK
jgi:periplasmic protein TonB